MSPDDRIRLQHMLDAADAAMRSWQERSRGDLDTDDMLRFALTLAAAKRIVEIEDYAFASGRNPSITSASRFGWS